MRFSTPPLSLLPNQLRGKVPPARTGNVLRRMPVQCPGVQVDLRPLQKLAQQLDAILARVDEIVEHGPPVVVSRVPIEVYTPKDVHPVQPVDRIVKEYVQDGVAVLGRGLPSSRIEAAGVDHLDEESPVVALDNVRKLCFFLQ